VSRKPSTTSYALLGLLTFDQVTSTRGLTEDELKQRADRTLRFYWETPTRAEIRSDLVRLEQDGLVETADEISSNDRVRHVRITPRGREALDAWLHTTEPEFPVLRHPVALRLMMGSLFEPHQLGAMLNGYRRDLRERRADLEAVRDRLGDNVETKYAAMVAEWGLDYYDAEKAVIDGLAEKIAASWINRPQQDPTTENGESA